MKRIVTLSLVLAMCLALLTGCGGSQSEETQEPAESQGTEETGSAGGSEAEFVWVASCANTEDHPAVQGVMKFAELLEEKSGGRIHMDVFHSAQLASDRDCIEGMQINTIQSGIMVGSALAGFTDELLVFDLPFLFENSEQGQKLCDSDVGKEMLASLDDIGIKGLGFMEYGMRNITNSKLPIEKPEDLQGIKIRTMENQIHMEAFSVMGADPTPMAFGELFTALQQGTVDGQENPLDTILQHRYYEVQDYLTITNHLVAVAGLFVNNDWFEGLDPEIQAAFEEAAQKSETYAREAWHAENDATLEELKGLMEVNELDDAALNEFQEAAKSAWTEAAAYIGEEYFNQFLETSGLSVE